MLMEYVYPSLDTTGLEDTHDYSGKSHSLRRHTLDTYQLPSTMMGPVLKELNSPVGQDSP